MHPSFWLYGSVYFFKKDITFYFVKNTKLIYIIFSRKTTYKNNKTILI